MVDPEAAEDRERLEDALHVLHGSAGTGLVRRLLYVLYLIVIFGGVYGFNLLRAALVTSDPRWLDSVASVWGVLAAGVAAAGLGLLAWRAGRVRGPVVPQLPFIDTVVASAIDRGVVLRERGLVVLIGGAGAGLLLGALAGGAVVGAGRGGVAVVLGAVVCGAGLGLALAWISVLGQAAASGSRRVRTLGAALRALRLVDLREHAVRTTHIGGAVLAGDLRAARLDVAAPVTRARSVRLRSRGPWRTLIARDVLGLRRAPGRLAWGLVGVAAAYGLIAVRATTPSLPLATGMLAMVLAYFAVGALAEGVRLLADNAGTPPLLGLGFRTEALLHLVVPVAMTLAVGLPASVLVAASDASIGIAVLAAAGMTLILAGTTLMAAFRGSPPDLSFIGEIGPMSMAYWYARPVTTAAISGGLLLALIAEAGPIALVGAFGTGGFALGYGLWLARKLELGHRS